MLIFNNWYVAAFAHDVQPLKVLSRRICDLPVVLYRTANGRAVALEDRCSHRAMPLSYDNGRCEGENIRCPYHGLLFGPDGVCVEVPSQDRVPPTANIRAYPLVEKDGALWIWPGRPEHADPKLIPDYPFHTDPSYRWASFTTEFEASWDLVLDNLCDMTHISFVHTGVNGDTEAHLKAKMSVKPWGDRGVSIERQLPNCDPPPHYIKMGGFTGKVDRWQEIKITPNLAQFYTGATEAGTGAFEGKRNHGVGLRSYHGITPKTETSCYYHLANARDFGLDDPSLDEKMTESAWLTVHIEDRPVIEAQQKRILEEPNRKMVDIQADAGGLQLRRIMARMHREDLELQGAA